MHHKADRIVGVLFGLGTHALFAFTVWYLFWFLKGGASGSWSIAAAGRDALLALQFAVFHSLLLYPRVRKRLTAGTIRDAFYGCLFCVVTCFSLLLTFALWRPGEELFRFRGPAAWIVQGLFYFSWVALFYSLNLTGLGYQTGWTPWWHWFRGRTPPRRTFRPRGAYRWLRHPVYLSFLGLLWFTPVYTQDRLLLNLLWSGYIFVGSWLKDRRLLFYLGQTYRQYQAQVPGYPLLGWGPLGRVPG